MPPSAWCGRAFAGSRRSGITLDCLASGRPGAIDSLDRTAGGELNLTSRRTRMLSEDGRGAINAVAVSEDGTLAALAGRRRVVILRTGTLHPCAMMTEPAAPAGGSLAFDDRRDALVLVRVDNDPIQIPLPPGCQASGGATPEVPDWPPASGAQTAVVLGDGTVALGTLFGRVILQTPPASYSTGGFLAQRGAVLGEANAAGSLVPSAAKAGCGCGR